MPNLFSYFEELERKRRGQTPPPQNRIALGAPPVAAVAPMNPFAPEIPVATDSRIALTSPLTHESQNALSQYGGITDTTDKEARPVLNNPDNGNEAVLAEAQNGVIIPTPVRIQQPIQEDELTTASNRLRDLRDYKTNPVVNNDKGILGRIGDVLRQMVISGGQGYSQGLQSGMSPEQALAGAAGAGIAGGAYGGFHPQVDEERQRLYDISKGQADVDRIKLDQEWKTKQDAIQANTELVRQKPEIEANKLKTKIAESQKAFDRRMKVLDQQQKFAGNQWEKYIDDEGKVWKKYKDGRMDAVVLSNGEQDTMPGEQAVEWTNPRTGKTETVKAKQILMPDATIAKQEDQQEFTAERDEKQRTFVLKRDGILNQYAMEKKEFDAAMDAQKAATTDAARQAAAANAEASRLRILEYQNQLQMLRDENQSQLGAERDAAKKNK